MITALNPSYFAFFNDCLINIDPIPLICLEGNTLTGPKVITGSSVPFS